MKKVFLAFAFSSFVVAIVLIVVFAVPKYPKKYALEIEAASKRYGVSKALVFAVCYAESGFNTNAVSSAGAVGIMQIMPKTAEWIASELGYATYDLFDAKTNIEFGGFYLSYLLSKFGDETAAIAAYNAGENNVAKWNFETENFGLKDIQFSETREYVTKVEKAKLWYEKN